MFQFIRPLVTTALSFRWRVVHWIIQTDFLRAQQKLGKTGAYDIEAQVLMKEEQAQRERRWIESRLRAYPYWREGHHYIARQALLYGDASLAYAAASTCKALSSSSSEIDESDHLLAKSLLMAGDAHRALPLLERLLHPAAGNDDVREDLVASYLALDRPREAMQVLAEIPVERRSASMAESYRYLKTKIID